MNYNEDFIDLIFRNSHAWYFWISSYIFDGMRGKYLTKWLNITFKRQNVGLKYAGK